MFKFKTLVDGAKKSVLTGTAVVLSAATPLVHAAATPPDYSVIQNAVDWSSVATGILAILALGAGVIVAFVGGKFLIAAIKGSK